LIISCFRFYYVPLISEKALLIFEKARLISEKARLNLQ